MSAADATGTTSVTTGVSGGRWRASVMPWGAVCPWTGTPLNWFVAADDRWHVPESEPSVRQQRIEGTPVTETRVRVPGQTYLVTMRMAGTMERMQPQFTSDPPLQTLDILTLLFSDQAPSGDIEKRNVWRSVGLARRRDFASRRQIPESNDAADGVRRERARAVGRDGDVLRAFALEQRAYDASVGDVPDSHLAVAAAGERQSAIGRHGQ